MTPLVPGLAGQPPPAPHETTPKALDQAEKWADMRGSECWADEVSGFPHAEDVCREPGPFRCTLGLCDVHCPEIHEGVH